VYIVTVVDFAAVFRLPTDDVWVGVNSGEMGDRSPNILHGWIYGRFPESHFHGKTL